MNIMDKIKITGGDFTTRQYDRFVCPDKYYEHHLDYRFVETALQFTMI